MNFIDYSRIGFDAFCSSSKQDEIIKRKQEILDAVFAHHRVSPQTLLFVGFNPAMFAFKQHKITVSHITDDVLAYIRKQIPSAEIVEWNHMELGVDQFDAVIAMDEFLTFAETEDAQHAQLLKICALSKQTTITTLRDYKNQGFKDREFSIPSLVRGTSSDRIYLEYHDYDLQDRNAWLRSIFEIEGSTMRAYAGFQCRQMFFKQCAKFSLDAGARDFLIHKNIMYKSLVKKNYEHVISMRFDNGRSQTSR
jgi:hypothetical protein